MRNEREKTNKVLEELVEKEEITLDKVSSIIGEEKEEAKELVKKMEKKGLLDNNQGKFSITGKGHKRFNNFKTGRSKSDTDNRRLDTF